MAPPHPTVPKEKEKTPLAINKAMLAAIKAMSEQDIDVKKNYKLVRAAERLAHPPVTPLLPYSTWEHEVRCGDHLVPVRIFRPDNGEPIPKILLFFHGGGWVIGDIDSYDKTCHVLANQTGRLVVSVDYRLAPEHPYPAGLEDCYAVAREIFMDDSLFITRPEEIVLIGDSAGGNLAAAVSLLARDRGEFLPQKQILIYPATYHDHSEDSPFESVRENGTDYILTSKRVNDYLEMYTPNPEDRTSPYVAPLLAKDLSRQPETLILTGQYCPLRDEGEEYGRQLALAGNAVQVQRIPDALHGYFTQPVRYEPVRLSYQYINEFLAR